MLEYAIASCAVAHGWSHYLQAFLALFDVHLPPSLAIDPMSATPEVLAGAWHLGPIPIRLDPDAAGEVVWCDRIDPARAVVRSVPLPGSGCHELDVVLHDGEPNGYRVWDGRRLPVFDALEILVRSDRDTLELRLAAPREEDVRELARLAETMGMTVEDWTATVRPICRRCSEGVPHSEHDEPAPAPWSPLRHVGVSAGAGHRAGALLARWSAESPGRRVIEGPR